MTKHVVIIGAGIGGIATANLLAKAGYDVTVIEKNDQPGGRAGLLKKDGFTFDTGPSWYLMPDVFDHYFSLLGKSISDEIELTRLSPAYKVFFENHPPVEITSNLDVDAETFEKIEQGTGKKLQSYVKKGDIIYRLSLKHFLYTNFASIRSFLKTDILRRGPTMSRLAFTPIDNYVRRFVTDTRLRQILEYPMVFLGSSPFSAPAIYSLMSALDFKEGVFYPQGGIYTIIERLVAASEELNVSMQLNTSVTSIDTKDGKVVGVTLANGTRVSADIVISNADLHFTETSLLKPADRSYPASYWNKREAGPSALLMYLGVRGSLPELEHHNLFFVDDWKENFDAIFENKQLPNPASIYICKPSATDTTVAPEGHENVFVLVPLPAGYSVESHALRKAADAYLLQIEKSLGIKNLRHRIVTKELFGPHDFHEKFNAWQNTALGPSHILKQSAIFRTPNKSRKVKNLYYVGGSTTPGIGLPMCLIGAELIYKRLTRDTSSGPVAKIKNIAKGKS